MILTLKSPRAAALATCNFPETYLLKSPCLSHKISYFRGVPVVGPRREISGAFLFCVDYICDKSYIRVIPTRENRMIDFDTEDNKNLSIKKNNVSIMDQLDSEQ